QARAKEATAATLRGGRVTSEVMSQEMAEVHAPYDGSLIGEVPVATASDVDSAVAAARDVLRAEPLPLWRRAAILDAAAQRLAARRDEFATTIAREAAKPLATARIEVDRAVGTFLFAAAEARTLAGEMVPLDA